MRREDDVKKHKKYSNRTRLQMLATDRRLLEWTRQEDLVGPGRQKFTHILNALEFGPNVGKRAMFAIVAVSAQCKTKIGAPKMRMLRWSAGELCTMGGPRCLPK